MLNRITRIFGIRTQRQFRLTLRGLAIVMVTGSGFAVALLMEKSLFWWATLPFFVLLCGAILEFIVGDLLAEQSYPFETEKLLDLLEQQLGREAANSISSKLERMIDDFKACDRSRISGTVHILVPLAPIPEEPKRSGLLQLTDYVGPRGGSKGRITTLDQGIIGRCMRTHAIEHVNFGDRVEYLRRMVKEFGFSKEETDRHTTIARSYIAVPLRRKSRGVGVLYFFSTEPQVFPQAASHVDLDGKAEDVIDVLKTASIV